MSGMAFFLYDPLSALVAILYTYLLAHGIAPINGANIEATALFLMVKNAGGLM